MKKITKIIPALVLAAALSVPVANQFYTTNANTKVSLEADSSTKTIIGLDETMMYTTDGGNDWRVGRENTRFRGRVTVIVADRDDEIINAPLYDINSAYPGGSKVRYNGQIWTASFWVEPGEVPGSAASQGDNGWGLSGKPININELGTFDFFPLTGEEAENFQKSEKERYASMKKVTGYYTEWSVYEPHDYFTPDKVDMSLLTHLNYGFGVIRDGIVQVHDTYKGPENMRQFSALTAYNDVSFMLSVGGWNNSLDGVFEEATATHAGTQKLVDSIIDYVQEWNFDGVDIDWEYPSDSKAKEQFVDLVTTLRSELDILGRSSDKYYQLSAAVTADHNKMQYIDPTNTMNYLDTINVMSYDFHGSFDPITGHNSPLFSNSNPNDADKKFNTAAAMKEYNEVYGVPKQKLLQGLAFYGRGWGDVAGTEIVKGLPGLFNTGTATINGQWDDENEFTGTTPWYTLKDWLGKGGYERYWDDEAKVPYLYNSITKEFFSYDDPQSIEYKTDYIIDQDYGGAIIWELSGDTADHELGKIVSKIIPDDTEESESIAPNITSQPKDAMLSSSNSVAGLKVSAEAPNGGRLSYQWYRSKINSTTGGIAIAGETTPSYAVDANEYADGYHYYYVVVTNTVNNKSETTTSEIATISIDYTPVIKNMDVNKVIMQNAHFTAVEVEAEALDGGTLTYQWYRSNTDGYSNAILDNNYKYGEALLVPQLKDENGYYINLESEYIHVVVTYTKGNISVSTRSEIIFIDHSWWWELHNSI